jgi:hypothetical protein
VGTVTAPAEPALKRAIRVEPQQFGCLRLRYDDPSGVRNGYGGDCR